MNPREKGFLLLTSRMGNPDRRVLTSAQLRVLGERMRCVKLPNEDRELRSEDLIAFGGYNSSMAERIVGLLEEEEQLAHYCRKGKTVGCVPITRVSEGYPALMRQRLGLESPGCLWAKGDLSILNTPAVSLVGSRDLNPENRAFARAVGRMAAERGMTLISGNARGADRAAQEACLAAGGRVISIVADELAKQKQRDGILYLSEDGYDEPFSVQRALSRNRCIHTMGQMVFVAQASLGKGGTWDGTTKNLRHGWSSIACFRDGSEAALELEQMGAFLIGTADLEDFSWTSFQQTFF